MSNHLAQLNNYPNHIEVNFANFSTTIWATIYCKFACLNGGIEKCSTTISCESLFKSIGRKRTSPLILHCSQLEDPQQNTWSTLQAIHHIHQAIKPSEVINLRTRKKTSERW